MTSSIKLVSSYLVKIDLSRINLSFLQVFFFFISPLPPGSRSPSALFSSFLQFFFQWGAFMLFDTFRTLMCMVLFLALGALVYLYFLPPGRSGK